MKRSDGDLEGREGPGTLASIATQKLRLALAAGTFRPGERLRMASLCRFLEAGSSPVREALNRLAAEGLIDQHDQRGFWVPPVSLADLEELTRTRRWINEVALREAIKRGDGRGKSKSSSPSIGSTRLNARAT
jgi:DNA-binding GntR family transcriptional regulator